MNVPSIEVEHIAVTYRNGFNAIRDTSFSISKGTICALAGANGSGKSTIFKCLMGQVHPTQGKIRINGTQVKQALKHNQVAYVPQSEEVDWNFPILVSEVVMMGRYGKMNFLRIPSKQDKQKVSQALERVGLSDFSQRQIGELSGGQKKRVFLARALAQESKILLLDEPFTGVDLKTENRIIQLLKALRDEGHLILVSTHNLGSIPEFCDHTILVNQTVLASGPTDATFTPENLKLAFGGVLRSISLSAQTLHHDDDQREITVISDDEKAAVFYGEPNKE